MENQVKSKYLWVLGLKLCLETVYRMWDLLELLWVVKSPSPLMVEKSYCIPNKFPALPQAKGEDMSHCTLLSPPPFLCKPKQTSDWPTLKINWKHIYILQCEFLFWGKIYLHKFWIYRCALSIWEFRSDSHSCKKLLFLITLSFELAPEL